MNYLAHAYFSFGHEEVLVGNMISDFVKGKSQYDYPALVHAGIKLHRMIDEFTDTHAATKEGKQVFKLAVGLYSGAFMDVVYDHFLAKDENLFPDDNLYRFTISTYNSIDKQSGLLPPKFA